MEDEEYEKISELEKYEDIIPDLPCEDHTPLYLACMCKDFEEVTRLLDEGNDVNKLNSEKSWYGGEAPIHAAVLVKSLPLVRLLTERGADINSVINDYTGNTPLHVAVEKNGNLEIVQYLLESGADYTCQNKFKETPLEYSKRLFNQKLLTGQNRNPESIITLLEEYENKVDIKEPECVN